MAFIRNLNLEMKLKNRKDTSITMNHLALYQAAILKDYAIFYRSLNANEAQDQVEKLSKGISFKISKTYIKVITLNSVHSFIKIGEATPLNKFKDGDILKAAIWNAPAKNFIRGNLLEGTIEMVKWTGVG